MGIRLDYGRLLFKNNLVLNRVLTTEPQTQVHLDRVMQSVAHGVCPMSLCHP